MDPPFQLEFCLWVEAGLSVEGLLEALHTIESQHDSSLGYTGKSSGRPIAGPGLAHAPDSARGSAQQVPQRA